MPPIAEQQSETESSAARSAGKEGGEEQGSGLLPAISLPKGGGAIRGIGEKFASNPVTGTGSMTIPIATSPGRSGFAPQLALSYDSGSGNGSFGFGWNLSLPAITRKTDKGLPQYRDAEESDVFILSGAEDLVPVLLPDETRYEDTTSHPGFTIHRYRPRIEGLFARIERWTEDVTGDVHWRSITRENITTIYGRSNDSRIHDPGEASWPNPRRIFKWLICESYDDKGNAIVYEYAAENDVLVDRTRANERNRVRTANRYLKRIKYGNRVSRLVEPDLSKAEWLFEVVFDYDEDHYTQLHLDPERSEAEQHRFAQACIDSNGNWRVRPDPFSVYRPGFEVRSYRRCRRVLMFHCFAELGPEPCLVRATEFEYDDLVDYDHHAPPSLEAELSHQGSTRYASFIRRVVQSGYVRDEARPVEVRDGLRYVTYLQKSLPPLEFEYSKAKIQEEVQYLDEESQENLPVGVDLTGYQWVDLDGEGLSGILTKQGSAWHYKPNLGGGKFGPMQTLPTQPSLFAQVGGEHLLDLSGDGQLDVVAFAGTARGFYERTVDFDWESFRTFRQLPNIRLDDPHIRFIDLTGDGHADVLVTEHEVFTWYRSLQEEGFDSAQHVRKPRDEEKGPRLVFADRRQSIYLADMSGDGLTDLVRITNREACYWPNIGYGRFGAKVTMDNAPWLDQSDQFDPARLRLADIDGGGASDILYIGRDGVRLYFNQAGNAWSEARKLHAVPPFDNLSSVTVSDLLGNGTACLVWSTLPPADAKSRLRYIDLMGGHKPHLLVKVINNLGAETIVSYAPSTKFYVEDKRNGKPWITRIPFPVHVVERVETYDRISNGRFVTRYAYHHGYFDGHEREFRGFGLVEQYDTEEFAMLRASGVFPTGANVEASSHVPPVLTKSWFHTGAYLGRDHISDYFAGLVDARDTGEYFREPGLTDTQTRNLLLDDTILPADLMPDEEREACRALRGSLLRQEVYALDNSDKESLPYAVTERNYSVKRLQGRGDNRHSVFLTHAREELIYNYERTIVPVIGKQLVDEATAAANPRAEWLLDPRVGHSLTLEVDDFGNVLKTASIGYGRRFADASLLQAVQEEQAKTHLTYTENRVTNSIDEAAAYRTPLAYEARTYELTGYIPSGIAGHFCAEDLVTRRPADTTAFNAVFDDELSYEELPTDGKQRRLIEHVRTVFRRDDLVDALSLGQLESMALPFETYRLALTPGLILQVFNENGPVNRVSDEMLEGTESTPGGGYVHMRNEAGVLDSNWWIPSGRLFFSPGSNDSAAEELNHARAHFFLPQRGRNPFHTAAASTESFVVYDHYDLMVSESRDALDNRVTVGERHQDPTQSLVKSGQDYRVLQPALVMDPNRNRTAMAFDVLGMVAGSAVMGKPEDNPPVGDKLTQAFRPDLTQAELDAFLATPKGPIAAQLLAEATSRVITDLTMYFREPDLAKKRPVFAATLARETHVSEPLSPSGLRIQINFSYSDGFGREVQKKMQAAPGQVPLRDANGAVVVDANNQPQMTPNSVSPRWVGTGWTIFNNKGKAVRKYEPYFTDTHLFERDVRIGVSSILFYDPIARVVATLFANHTWKKVIFGPWYAASWGVSDTVLIAAPEPDADVGSWFARLPAREYTPTWHGLRTDPAYASLFAARYPDADLRANEQTAARQSETYAQTPTFAHADSLGRTILKVAHNRFQHSNAAAPAEEFYVTRVVFDIEGNQREIIDTNERLVLRYDYDMLGDRIHRAGMEAGSRWSLSDVALKPIYTWDSRGHRFRTTYDVLARPIEDFLLEDVGPEVLVGRSVYGESRDAPEAHNLRGRPVEIFDQAGIVVTDRYDFKGNQLSTTRQLADTVEVDGHSQPCYKVRVDWRAAVTPILEKYVTHSSFDALNRPIQLVAPRSDQPGAKINVLQRVYNDASLLERVDVWLDHGNVPDALVEPEVNAPSAVGVVNIDYDAKGQRLRIDYKNGVSTHYSYDFETFRLVHMRTEVAGPGQRLQDLDYTFDVAGNLTHIRDNAQQTVFFANARVEPSARYIYDATFRLIEATGREHLGEIGGAPIPPSYDDAPRVGRVGIPNEEDGQALGKYIERYLYDQVGNLSSMRHVGSDPRQPGWTQTYAYHEPSQLEPGESSNRLSSTTIGSETAVYSNEGDGYDAHGNMLKMPQLSIMVWNDRDQLQMTQRQAVNERDTDGEQREGEQTWYVYDSGGQRIRKVTALPNGRIRDERLYLGGFEVYRKPADDLVRETLHIMDDKQRIALVETRVQGNEPEIPQQLVRYQFGNHVGSACLETDEQARLLSYEEYTPYGSTAYQAVRSRLQTPKRYRFTGMERDEESGLSYHAARYYAPWLARWTACDPAGPVDSVSLYVYAANNPVSFVDPLGSECDPTTQSCVDTTEPTVREEALQQSLPEEERYLPPPESTSSADPPSGSTSEPGIPGLEIASGGVGVTSLGLRSYFAPLSASGEALQGPFILWSRKALETARAMEAAREGHTIFQTRAGVQMEAELAALRRVPGFPGAFRSELPREEAGEIMRRYSRIAAREAGISGVGVTTANAPGTIPAGSIQELEIRTARFYGTGMGALNVGGGVLMLSSINTERDPGIITGGKIVSGGASVVGGGLEIYGAWTLTAGATTTGAALSGVGTIVAVPIIMYEIYRPRGFMAYDPVLADRAIREGRNPFCAQCHGPGGALDPNNDWNAGGARREAFVRRLQWVDLGE